jgi:hypothetical protein
MDRTDGFISSPRQEFRYENKLGDVCDLPSHSGCIGCGFQALFRSVDQKAFFQQLAGVQFRREKYRLQTLKNGHFPEEVPRNLVELNLVPFCQRCCPKFDASDPVNNLAELSETFLKK